MAKLVAIADLMPTQMTLGMHFVGLNRTEFANLSRKKMEKLVRKRPVPAIRGPGDRLWMTDRHHFCRALHDIGVETVRIEISHDTRHLSMDEFSHFMEKSGLIHPYDEIGGRRGFADLPASISRLVDDPYRTLAGMVREDGGFAKETRPYAEFLWADFFRSRIDRALLAGDFTAARKRAGKLAYQKAARHLPGWNEQN